MSNNSNLSYTQGIDLSTYYFLPSPQTWAVITWSVLLGVIGIVALVTNVLTIAAFTQKRLRRPPHYLLISLACADFMVASISVPLYICITLGVTKLTLRSRAAIWFFDFLSGMASIFTLASVSLERLFAMGWPLRHRVIPPITYAVFVTVPWVLALIVASLPLFDMFRLLPHLFMFQVILASCSFPIVVTIIAYITLWFKVKTSDPSGHERSREKDKRLAITLVIASFIFPFTWLPYTIVLSIINLCMKCVFSNVKLFNGLSMICMFMHLANSFLNPLVYILRIPEFRGAIRELICRNRPFRRVGVTPLANTRARNQANQAPSLAGSHGN
ncbi:adenosine receptor A2a-like [Orbicella faveolata]|uniref:adenosine receptor A2a-like n=1 Tax=Orbicella faveolata TaxID=48498 RepID=UPI0009E4DBEB|nr:adenosine receptor A2a-like [Orbicella faveolata]